MLSRDALNSALPLTASLDSADLYLTAIPATPLAALVKATRSDPNFVIATHGGYEPDVSSIEYIANKKDDVLAFSPHDAAMDDVVEVAVKAVQEHIAFARTVVAPAVEELVQNTTTTLNELKTSSLLGMEVVVWSPPAPLLNSALEASVRRFDEVAYDVPALRMKLPTITVKEMQDLMHVNSKGLDNDIDEWVATKGESFFIALWENVFQQKPNGLNDRAIYVFSDYINDREQGVDNALAIYLLTRRLVDSPLDGTEMSLKEFEKLAIEYRNQAGARLVRAIDEFDRIMKNGMLVRNTTERVTVVNGPVYRQWIEQGGDNDVLFGNLLDLPAVATVEQLNMKASALRAKWHQHCLLTATVESNRRFSRVKEILLSHFEKQLMAVTEGEEATVTNREMVLKLFHEQLAMVRETEIADLYTLCLRLVCRSRFYRTDAERILEGIERIKKDNPSIDVREAAAVSVIEYVAYWVASQFKVNAI